MYRTNRLLIAFFCFLALGFTLLNPHGASARAREIAPTSSLARHIDALLTNPQLRGAQVGINIVALTPNGPTAIYSYHPTLPLMPGSNAKLLTTAAAFDHFGPHGVLATRLYRVGENLVIVGGGDPALGDPVLCRQAGWTSTTVFEKWAGRLKSLGLTRFQDVVVDDHICSEDFVNSHWPLYGGQYLAWYEAPVGGLNFALNCLQWRPVVNPNGTIGVALDPPSDYTPVTIEARHGSTQNFWMWRPRGGSQFILRGSVGQSDPYWRQTTVADPGLYTGAVLRQTLVGQGIQITGPVRRGVLANLAAQAGQQPQLLATYETPLTAILRRANTNSINLMAEALCKLLGHDATGQPGDWVNGDAAVQAYLRTLGIPAAWVQLTDGSGLSHLDHVAPAAFTQVLAHIAAEKEGSVFIDSLCQPGHGTLIHRFRGSVVGRHVRAKDGHITGASTLSGYVFTPRETLVFSIMCNHYHGNVNGWQDRVVTALFNAESDHPK